MFMREKLNFLTKTVQNSAIGLSYLTRQSNQVYGLPPAASIAEFGAVFFKKVVCFIH